MTYLLTAAGFITLCFLAGYLAERAAFKSLVGDRDLDDVINPHLSRKE